jgi:tetratricopeptide (TPR) repeat protein
MLRRSFGVSLLLICITAPISLRAQRMGGRAVGGVIDVQVRYANGAPGPSGILVQLESAESGSAGNCRTTEGGKCVFNVPSNGVYVVRMAERGYRDVSVRVEIIGNPRGYATLDLIPIPAEVPPATSEAASAGDPNLVSALDLNVPENARQEFEKGQSALKENKLDDGVSHLRAAIKLYAAFPQAYTLLGTAYLQQKNWKDAESALKKATDLDAKFPDAYIELGAVLNQTKEYSRAETALLKGLELKPEAAAGHYELAKTYWALGRWQDAAPHARQSVAGMPDLAGPHALLGNIMLRERNAPGALREYQEYLRLEPNGAEAPGVRDMVAKIENALQKK